MNEKTTVDGNASPGRRLLRIAWMVVGLLVVSFLFLLAAVRNRFIIEIPFHITLGWLSHAHEVSPALSTGARSILLPACCLCLAGILLHRFVRNTLVAKETSIIWRAKDTIASLLLLLSGCAAAIALSGVAHQIAWLAGSPVIEDRSRKTNIVVAMNNARQLAYSIDEFGETKGRLPNSLRELENESEAEFRGTSPIAWFRNRWDSVPEPFVLLHPGGAIPKKIEPLIVSPVIPNDGRIVVGYSDGNVTIVPQEQLGAILRGLETRQPRQPEAR
ncbi:hypothetical protein JIN84_03945 [Luteolibacter yonseiensis]|uniref:Uncharacterized protein n=1 Tax=Luteolibacter yonseiensis TaxID=1144680 RepID=A0A934R0Q1_9BACT|nr:hypothetical protein [Luteolibacter yonseiensis]MBK1814751.1 hypothetical protein [Luteolibacter yonseiensis]